MQSSSAREPLAVPLTIRYRAPHRCTICFRFVDRDQNACCNLLAAYWARRAGQERPGYLRNQNQLEEPGGGVGPAGGRPAAHTRLDARVWQ